VTIPAAMVDRYSDHGRIRYVDTLRGDDFANHPGSIALYPVRTRASQKKDSANSNPADLRVYPAFDAIADLRAETTHDAIVLSWTAPSKVPAGPLPAIGGYRIYRGELQTGNASGSAGATSANAKLNSPLVRIGEIDGSSPTFSDQQFDFKKTYAYSVRSIAQYPGEPIESDDSNLVVITPRDTFPPTAPLGLVVVVVPAEEGVAAHTELSWAISPESDIAGYNVYRVEQAGNPGTRLNSQLLLTPAFRDMNVELGHSYSYDVTAVDRSGNESPLSATVSGEVPAEAKPDHD
jgi:hypothetical protein